MRVKLFWRNQPGRPTTGPVGLGQLTWGNAQEFEGQINAWLRQNPGIKVLDIKQSASGGSFGESLWFISVWYDENKA